MGAGREAPGSADWDAVCAGSVPRLQTDESVDLAAHGPSASGKAVVEVPPTGLSINVRGVPGFLRMPEGVRCR